MTKPAAPTPKANAIHVPDADQRQVSEASEASAPVGPKIPSTSVAQNSMLTETCEYRRGYQHAVADMIDLIEGGYGVEDLLAWERIIKNWRWENQPLEGGK